MSLQDGRCLHEATEWRERLAAAISAWIAENPPPVVERSGYVSVPGIVHAPGMREDGEVRWIAVPNADRMNRPEWLDELLAANGAKPRNEPKAGGPA